MAISARAIAQLQSLQNLGEIMPLPAAQWVAKRAREYAAVDTGHMRAHTVAKKKGPRSADVISSAPYAVHVEFGTHKMVAQPFIRPAVADAAIQLPGMTAKEVNAEIRRRVSRA